MLALGGENVVNVVIIAGQVDQEAGGLIPDGLGGPVTCRGGEC